MTYDEFIEQTALEVWQLWNSGEVRWREAIPHESYCYEYNKTPFELGRDVWNSVEANYGKYGRKL
jgi:hypothetical protein